MSVWTNYFKTLLCIRDKTDLKFCQKTVVYIRKKYSRLSWYRKVITVFVSIQVIQMSWTLYLFIPYIQLFLFMAIVKCELYGKTTLMFFSVLFFLSIQIFSFFHWISPRFKEKTERGGLSLKLLNCFSWPGLWHHSLENPQLLNVQNVIKKILVDFLSCADLGMALFAFVLVLFFISLISTSCVILLYYTTFIDLFIRVDYLGFYWHLVWI